MAKFNATQLEDFVRDRAPQIAHDIRAAAEKAHNEADLVAEVEKLLDRFDRNSDFDIQLHLERERTLLNGRADAVYNRLVIEYEPPHSLQKTNSAHTNRHAIDQVKQYMDGLERLDRHKKERLAGVVLDGYFFIFIRHREERWFEDDPLPVDAHSTQTFLRYLLSLSTELALTPDNLERDFGENSNTARQVVPAFYKAIKETQNPKAKILFQQWQRQFQEVSGYDPSSGQLDTAEIGKEYAIKDKNPDLDRLFFAIHTYYATFIKLLALQVAYFYLMPKVGSGLASSSDYPSDKLCDYLQEMERGGLFAQLGIRNFLEGDFFGWYLDIWDEKLDIAMRRLISDLANYSLVTLDIDPEETRDLLKQLYQNLMPKKLRHALGEYYTPDWLAERLLNQLGYEGDPKTRLLDPACGSGTFLVLAIKRIRKYADDKMLPPARVLEQILTNVVGYDLNPLAVISSRTNYLLALGDLLESRRGDITIPIYICDSILTPSEGTDLFTQNGYSFNTTVGRFSVPHSLVKAHYIDQLTDLLEECIHSQLSTEVFQTRFLQMFPLREPQDTSEINLALKLYQQLISYEEKGINGIWARIIKNAFAPLFQDKFDLIAGNPPWVNWESLPTEYRQDTKPLWVYHGLFPHSGMDTILGKGKKDISMLMTYVSTENYLKDGGRLGFVITQSVFKTAGAGQGFRRFILGNNIPLAIIGVDDMASLKPFEGATNRTAIVILEKNRLTRYPLNAYSVWYKPGGGATIQEDLSLAEITGSKIVSYRSFSAKPVDDTDITSPWITGRLRAIQATKIVLGKSYYRAYEGSNTGGANGIFWLEIVNRRPGNLVVVSNITEGAKREVESIQSAIEDGLIFPLLRGRDVKRWSTKPQASILMVQDPTKRRGYDEGWLSRTYPKTYSYLKRFEKPLLERSAYRRYFNSQDDPFYSMFNIGMYTFLPYKVVWREQADGLTAAVTESIESKVVIPDHKLMLVGLEDKNEAYYLCALLNSSPARYIVSSYGISISLNTHILEHVRVPAFIDTNNICINLSLLSQQAHELTKEGDLAKIVDIEGEIDRLAASIWELTEEELREIQDCLAELK